jgi:hypothetical protein
MKSATSFGFESMGMWLVGRVSVFCVHFLCASRSCCGEIMRSSEAITNQLGLLCHAAAEIVLPRAAPLSRGLRCNQDHLFLVCEIPGKALKNALFRKHQETILDRSQFPDPQASVRKVFPYSLAIRPDPARIYAT